MILQFPTHQLDTRREIAFVSESLGRLKLEADEIHDRIKKMEVEALSSAQKYFELTTEILFLHARLVYLQGALAEKEPPQRGPYPIQQLELF